jgi:hypothetical protein
MELPSRLRRLDFANRWVEIYSIISPNVTAKWLPLLLPIRKVPGLNLSPESGYPDSFSFYSTVPPGKYLGSTLN